MLAFSQFRRSFLRDKSQSLKIRHDEPQLAAIPQWNQTFATIRRAIVQLAALIENTLELHHRLVGLPPLAMSKINESV